MNNKQAQPGDLAYHTPDEGPQEWGFLTIPNSGENEKARILLPRMPNWGLSEKRVQSDKLRSLHSVDSDKVPGPTIIWLLTHVAKAYGHMRDAQVEAKRLRRRLANLEEIESKQLEQFEQFVQSVVSNYSGESRDIVESILNSAYPTPEPT